MMAMRALKRRLSTVVFARLLDDQLRREADREAGSGGAFGDAPDASVTPDIGPSDKPLPGPPI